MEFKHLFKRGSEANLPVLDDGEPAITTDENGNKKFWLGSANGNIPFSTKDDIEAFVGAEIGIVNEQLAEKANNKASIPVNTAPNFASNQSGKEIFRLRDTNDKTVMLAETESLPNGYTILNVFPSKDQSRSKISFWEKSIDSLVDGERPKRPLSIEAHSIAEDGEHDVTFYSCDNSDTNTESTATKVLQWHWGPDWDNRIEFLTMIQGNGKFIPSEWDEDFRVHIGYHGADAAQPIIHFGGEPTYPTRASVIENRGGVFRFRAGSTAIMEFDSPAGSRIKGGEFNVQNGIKIGGTQSQPASAGFYVGQRGDQSQPSMTLHPGSDANAWVVDNRSGTLRFISGVATNVTPKFAFTNGGNFGVGTDNRFGNGVGVVGIQNATTAPTANATNGGVLYVEGGALKFRGSSGTITEIAPA